jgi:hypothetical protein
MEGMTISERPTGEGIFLFTTASIPTRGPTQSPIHLTSGILLPEVKVPEREANDSLHLVHNLRMRGAVILLPHTFS